MIWFLRRHPVYGSVDTEVESVWPAPGSADCQAASQLIAAFAKAEQELKRRTRSTSRVASNITISNESRRVPMHFTVSRTLFRLQVTTPRRSNSVSSFLRDRYLSIEEKECERACRRRVPNSLTAKSARRTGFPLRRAIEKEPLGSVCPSLERQPWFAGRLSKIEPRRGITRRWQTRARVSRNHRGRICPGARCWCTCCRCTSRTIYGARARASPAWRLPRCARKVLPTFAPNCFAPFALDARRWTLFPIFRGTRIFNARDAEYTERFKYLNNAAQYLNK